MNKPGLERQSAKRAIERAGGVFVGVQETLNGSIYLFQDALTRTTLAVRWPVTAKAARMRIKESRRQFQSTSVIHQGSQP